MTRPTVAFVVLRRVVRAAGFDEDGLCCLDDGQSGLNQRTPRAWDDCEVVLA